MTITVREESENDIAAVDEVNEAAFNRRAEADLVLNLRNHGKVLLSLVAEQDGAIIGHILFTPMRIVSDNGDEYAAVGLGPIAVLPEFQKQGVGSKLMESGLDRCRKEEHEIMLVLGHPSYYPRFGFRPAVDFGIRCAYDVPDDAFMALELTPGALSQVSGKAYYEPEFDGA